MAVCGKCNGQITTQVNPQATASLNTPILVEFQGRLGQGNEALEYVGEATRYNYGLKQAGDVFAVWYADYMAEPALFKEV